MRLKSFPGLVLRLLITVYAIGLSHQECNTTSKSCAPRYSSSRIYGYRRYEDRNYGLSCGTAIICTNITDGDTIPGGSTSTVSLVILQSNIIKLNEEVFENVKLDNVTVINSGVKYLEPGVFHLDTNSLKIINLAFNNISDVTDSVFSDMLALKDVNISHNRIISISAEAFHGSPIETLDISSNQLKNINGFTRYNSELQILSLGNNAIEKLLNGTFNNPGLKRLELQYNQIELIETGVFLSLTALTFLDLGGNKLYKMSGGTLPSQFLQPLSELEVLNVYENSLKAIEENTFSQLKKLNGLNISNNNFDDIRTVLGDLEHLKALNVSNNNLTTIPIDSFKKLTELWYLDLSSNSIEELLPGTFSKLAYLHRLDLHANKLKTLPNGLLQYNRMLGILYINDNLLEELNRNVLTHPPIYIDIYLDDNKWSCDNLSAIIHMLKLISLSIGVAEGTHHSTPNIRGNSCSLNATVKSQNVTIETFLEKNLEMLQNLNENMVDDELANERIISLLTQSLASQNGTDGENSTLKVQVESMVTTLLEMRDILEKSNQANSRLLEENPPAASTGEQNHIKPQENSSLLVALLCTQIIFMLFIIGVVVYYVKFRDIFKRRTESTLLHSFDE